MKVLTYLTCTTCVLLLAACSKTPSPPPAVPAPEPPAAADSAPRVPAATGTIADLGGPSWTLQSFDQQEPVPAGISITLTVDGGSGGVSGQGGCNRYMGSVSNGDAPGTLKFGPLGMTRMACVPPVDQAESRYAKALQGASSFEVSGDTLMIHYLDGETRRTLIYKRG